MGPNMLGTLTVPTAASVRPADDVTDDAAPPALFTTLEPPLAIVVTIDEPPLTMVVATPVATLAAPLVASVERETCEQMRSSRQGMVTHRQRPR